MAAYEYTTETLTHGFMGRSRDELNRGALEEKLNQMGAEGWELVKILTDMAFEGEKDGHLMVFKRAR
ncbi:MAG TPA: DUF4177 domain-containing protein [Solirubrobacteraceae bacterium]|jgi:hypothetical protein